jgi:2-keto-4-pentenoate hydratase/2-oxohepta-3-ene-1,7-dioic acid hydratase in catechol pathway
MKLYRFLDADSQAVYAAEADGVLRKVAGDIFGDHTITDEEVRPKKILPPVEPPNIFAIGLNYRAHAMETQKPIPDAPVVFAKATTSLIGPGEPIILPAAGPAAVDYEVELAVVIGKTCRNVPAEDAAEYVLGYTVANDVSARDWQRRLGQWVRAKSFDTFCPLGPCIETDVDPSNLRLWSKLNGKLMQDSTTADLIFSVPRLVEFLSTDLILLAGTVILTGTPSGVGVARSPQVFLRPDDTITCAVQGIGELTNPVAAAGAGAGPKSSPDGTWGGP